MGALRSPALAQRDAITQPHTFRFFDVDLHVESDVPAFIAAFDALYARLRITASTARQPACVAAFRSGAPGHPVTLTLDGVRYAVAASPRLLPLLVDAVADAALARVRSHHLYHGATLAHGDRACLIVGASGFGKTTLALALAQRGPRLLSDEIGAVTASGHVSPFARAVRLRSPTPALLNLPPGTVHAAGHGQLLYASAHTWAAPAASPKLTHLFILDHGADDVSGPLVQSGSRLLLTGANPALERALHMTPGVAAVSPRMADAARLTEVVTAATAPPATVAAIRRRCAQARVLVLGVAPVATARPVFADAPQITPVATATALLATLPHLIGGPAASTRAAAADDASLPAAALVAELAAAFSTVRCFRVRPGPPGATAARILHLMDES
ncbi:MAG: hypothetical protein H6644_18505 [Caldilineaceae bacterium]|nr:hypothetical protein [Caldilineaceae bacterium]